MTSSRFPYPYVLWNGQPVLIGSDYESRESATANSRTRQLEMFSLRILSERPECDRGASKGTKGKRRTRSGGARAGTH